MEGGKNQLGPNVGAVDIIHNQSVARGGDNSTSFNFQLSQSAPQLVPLAQSRQSQPVSTNQEVGPAHQARGDRWRRQQGCGGNWQYSAGLADWRSFTSNLPTTN